MVHDYAQIIFGEGAGLTINNDFTISGAKTVVELQNLSLLSASQNESQVALVFENGITLYVSLVPEAYHGPEAMVLTREGQPVVVWN